MTKAAWPARELCLLGAGARTSLGIDLRSSAAAACSGIAEFSEHPFMVDLAGEPMVVARDPWLAAELEGGERLAELVATAVDECLSAAGLVAGGRRWPLRLWLALSEAERARTDGRAARVVSAVEEVLAGRCQLAGVSVLEHGHVAGAVAVCAAADAARAGYDGVCLVVGADSWLDPVSLEWLDATGRLHSPVHPFGFVPGEAAAAVLLGPPHWAGPAGVAGWIAGGALSFEPDLAPELPRLGRALTHAAREALADRNAAMPQVGTVYADLNGMPERADELGYTIVRLAERMAPGFGTVTPVEWFGDVGAASVPLMLALAGAGAAMGRVTGPALLLGQAIGGGRSALLMALPDAGGRP